MGAAASTLPTSAVAVMMSNDRFSISHRYLLDGKRVKPEPDDCIAEKTRGLQMLSCHFDLATAAAVERLHSVHWERLTGHHVLHSQFYDDGLITPRKRGTMVSRK